MYGPTDIFMHKEYKLSEKQRYLEDRAMELAFCKKDMFEAKHVNWFSPVTEIWYNQKEKWLIWAETYCL